MNKIIKTMEWFRQLSLSNKVGVISVFLTLIGIIIALIPLLKESTSTNTAVIKSPVINENKGNISIHYNEYPLNTSSIENKLDSTKKILEHIENNTLINNKSINYKKIKDPFVSIIYSAYKTNINDAKILLELYRDKLTNDEKTNATMWIDFFQKNKLPKETNALILNANNLNNSEEMAGEIIQSYLDGFSYKTLNSWYKKEIYENSKIIIVNQQYKIIGKYISMLLFKKDRTYDYINNSYQGLDDRDIVIFIGKDFKWKK